MGRIEHSGDYAGVHFSIETPPPTWIARSAGSKPVDVGALVNPDAQSAGKSQARNAQKGFNTKLIVGTEQGEVIYLDWKTVETDGKHGRKLQASGELIESHFTALP